MSIVKDGKLTIILYHGTSSFFVESIVNHGLGAVNLIESLKVLPLLKRLYDIANRIFQNDEEWILNKLCIDNIVKQEITKGGFNFRHGSTYLTPVELTAARYAINNPFGSEAISTTLSLYDKILQKDPNYQFDDEIKNSLLFKKSLSKYKPILIKVKNVKTSYLKGETDESILKVLGKLENALKEDERLFNVIAQQINFELIKSIEASQLEIFDIIVTKEDSIFPEYKLKIYT